MKTRLSIMALVATLACETEDPGLQFNAFKSIEDDCEFTENNPDLLSLTFDPQLFNSLTLYGQLQSTLTPPPTEIDMENGTILPGQVTINVTEFQYVFECDLSTFAGPRQLFLPAIGPSVPFCRNPSDPDADFEGRDLVNVSAAVERGEITTVATRVISPNLTGRLTELFALSVDAESCCGEDLDAGMACNLMGGMVGTSTRAACESLDEAVNMDMVLSTEQIPVLRTFREAVEVGRPDNEFLGPLQLSVQGNYRGITSRGSSLVSNEANIAIDVCSGCFANTEAVLEARANPPMGMPDGEAQTALDELRTVVNCFE